MKRIWLYLIILLAFSWSVTGCSERLTPPDLSSVEQVTESFTTGKGKLSEVSPPYLIQQLESALQQYQPQVSIISPKSEQVLDSTTVKVQLQVQDLPIFKDADLEMGPYLELILDNEPYQAIYDLENPIVLENLAPGTHTLRVFASRPWHESFKNEGAYAQTTFHIFTKTDDNHPDSNLALLTYSSPNGNYGAEPILLDFYLTNAPLHLIAQENPEDEIADWRIRVTINGESFLLDNWQPVYLKGFKEGSNWIQLEFLDEQGKAISNVYNNTVRLISYSANGQDSLSKLVRGELSLEQARGIIDPTAKVQPLPMPVLTPEPNPLEAPPEIPTEEKETLPQNTSLEEEKTLPSLPSTSGEEIPTEEPETLPAIPADSQEQILPEVISPTPETPATVPDVTETKQPPAKSSLNEEAPTSQENFSVQESPQEVSSSQEQSAITEEKTPQVNPSEFEEIIPTPEDKTSTVPAPVESERSFETLTETREDESKTVISDHSSTEKTTSSKPSIKDQWLDKILSRFKRD
ncbi:hypothetical protein [Gloeothece verrucosa]|uniref:FHA domain containing protein n=1 Tax=Gloeothece verrucosa (strain PCC 7822) TaxID=497965 RepID=E0UIB2_GLOV7|nr:hypothetical protein [Gloeothece verrucosa]ADN16880.1 conserved hypothetical protein [Gloeothece verrucosa PCC 7822]